MTYGNSFELPYIAGKFGTLAVYITTAKLIKICQNFLLAYIIHMVIPYRTAKFKSANSYSYTLGSTAKFIYIIPANISGYIHYTVTCRWCMACKCILSNKLRVTYPLLYNIIFYILLLLLHKCTCVYICNNRNLLKRHKQSLLH